MLVDWEETQVWIMRNDERLQVYKMTQDTGRVLYVLVAGIEESVDMWIGDDANFDFAYDGREGTYQDPDEQEDEIAEDEPPATP